MFCVILLPNFRLQAVLRLRQELRAQPAAVVDERSGKGAVIECNRLAESGGVAVGLPGVQALARCPDLMLLPPAHAQENSAQAALIELACSLSPEVEATADGCCTVDLRTAKIADWQNWTSRVVERLADLQLDGKIGVAPNPDLAFLAARRAAPALVVQSPVTFLSDLAVSEIDPPPHLLAVLGDWGIHTLGQLTSLPRGELADRLGPDADRLWQRASGQTQRLLRLVRPVEEFVEAFDFEQEIETTEPLLFMLRRFLDQLTMRLEMAHRVAAKLSLTLLLDNGSAHERVFAIPSPTADANVLFRVLNTHLESLQLDAHPTGMRLRIEPVRPDHRQFGLFETALRDPNGFGETLARLAALVGSGNVGVVELEDTHRPDRFHLVEPRFHELRESAGEARENIAFGLPLHRYRPPMAAEVRVVRQEPAEIFSETVRGRVVDALGPYRASGGWWEREQWGVEEWDVEIADHGLFRLCRNHREWVIEGCYDGELR